MNNKGIFIVQEGLDGSGKSTQLELIRKHIKSNYPNKKVILTREPGGTDCDLSEKIRDIILNNKMEDYTRALLYAASRYEHQLKIKKWLEEGYIVLCDRYIYSSLAYQAESIGEITEILSINRYEDIVKPDYVFHYDVSFETYLERKSKRLTERELDELEKKGDEFFKKNIKMYEKAYKELDDLHELYDLIVNVDVNTEFITIDANKTIMEVSEQVKSHLDKILK